MTGLFFSILGTKRKHVHFEGRTENIIPEDAFKILKTSIDWLYDKSEGIFELVVTHRNLQTQSEQLSSKTSQLLESLKLISDEQQQTSQYFEHKQIITGGYLFKRS